MAGRTSVATKSMPTIPTAIFSHGSIQHYPLPHQSHRQLHKTPPVLRFPASSPVNVPSLSRSWRLSRNKKPTYVVHSSYSLCFIVSKLCNSSYATSVLSTHHTGNSLLQPSSSCPQKRKHVHDENLPAIQLLNLSSPKKWKSPSSPQQKIAIVLSAIKNDKDLQSKRPKDHLTHAKTTKDLLHETNTVKRPPFVRRRCKSWGDNFADD